MRRRHFKLKVALAVTVVALLVLPGAAKPAVQSEAVVQTAFGTLADPHLNSAFHVELPDEFWTL
jgi:ferric-dicitrate binding protein FerR (iron transport regulator)